MTEFFNQKPSELTEFLDFMEEDIENIRRVVDFVEENDMDVEFIVHGKSETVGESVEKKGIEAEKIVKTLVFIAGGKPISVLCPADSRVSEEKLEEETGEEVRMADPEEVEKATGYIIGGVSPFDLEIPVYMEESILEHEIVDAAAGSRVVGAEVSPEELKECNSAEALDLIE
ncbi:MAG: aminoacyl-tRNA deacylase [Candidatus Nanohalobium sp.]